MEENLKQLLLKDLCERLPYGVVLDTGTQLRSINNLTQIISGFGTDKKIENTKYYLRPMSSMTKEEKEEYELLANHCIVTSIGFVCIEAQILIDWLNAHQFDYRGLIPMDLALEALEGMYKTE